MCLGSVQRVRIPDTQRGEPQEPGTFDRFRFVAWRRYVGADKIFIGKLPSIRPYIDPNTRTNTVEITLDNPRDRITGPWLLKPGMFGRAELIVSERKNVLAAPEPALLLDNRLLKQQRTGEILRKAFVVDDQGLAHQRLVRLGPVRFRLERFSV